MTTIPAIWYCGRPNELKRVAKSSLTAATLALSKGVDSAYYISTLFEEIMYGNSDNHKLPIEAYVDNKSLVDALKSTNFKDYVLISVQLKKWSQTNK